MKPEGRRQFQEKRVMSKEMSTHGVENLNRNSLYKINIIIMTNSGDLKPR